MSFVLPADVENAILEQVIQEYVLQMKDDDDLFDAFPGGLLPTMTPLSSEQRLARYATLTNPEDKALLDDPEYLKKYAAGMLPAPVSPFWLNQLRMPTLFHESQRDFNAVWRHHVAPIFDTEGPGMSPSADQGFIGGQ